MVDTRLDYAPAPATNRRKSIQRLLAGLAVVGGLAILAVFCLVWILRFASINLIRGEATQPFTAVYPLTRQQTSQPTGVFVYSKTGMKIYNHVAHCGNSHEVIVTVNADATMGLGMPRIMFRVRTSTFPNFWHGPQRQLLQFAGLALDADILYSGQPEPADASHFTIKYGQNGKTDIIDGWLMPDDTVKLEPRNKFQ